MRTGFLQFLSRRGTVVLLFVMATLATIASTAATGDAALAAPVQIYLPLGGSEFKGWSGLRNIAGGMADFPADGTAEFTASPTPPHTGWYSQGFVDRCGGTINFRHWYALKLRMYLPENAPATVRVTLQIPPQPQRESLIAATSATAALSGKGWCTVTLPWSAFDLPRAVPGTLQFIRHVTLHITTADGAAIFGVRLGHVGLIPGKSLHLACPVRSRAAAPGGSVQYRITVINCRAKTQSVSLAIQQSGWHAMQAAITPTQLTLHAGAGATCTVTVHVPTDIPAGGYESQHIIAVPEGDASLASRMTLITQSHLPPPSIMFTRAGWDAIREEIKKYPWAQKLADHYAREASTWQVPVAGQGQKFSREFNTRPLFAAYAGYPALHTAIAWQLTRNKIYAKKVALFLRRLANPRTGYPDTLMACHAGLVQEGQSFQCYARAYDLIRNAGVLTPQDCREINATLRLWMHVDSRALDMGDVSNWSISELVGGAYSAMDVQDRVDLRRFLYGPGGFKDQIRAGEMSDGWWFEGAVTYDFWCAREFTKLALACRPWGINLLTAQFPVRYSPIVGLHPYESQSLDGMSFAKAGQLDSNHVSIQRMWNGFLIYPDYRGVMFGINDAHEMRGAGSYALAYYAYHNPLYAAVAKKAITHHLLYSVAVLPEHTPQVDRRSGYSDNAAVVMLRSPDAGKPVSHAIQVVLRYGTHGGYHGHFDLTDLVSLMRYGQSFYNPETSWFGYGSAMYKLWVQVSLSHNMVVVDDKMQLPGPSRRLLFFSGKLMKAAAVQAICRWSNPPFGGGLFPHAYNGKKAPWYPQPAHPPAFGAITGKTGPILQRRVMIVTHNFVVVADYLHAAHAHTFDDLLQLRGARLADAAAQHYLKHTADLNSSPLGSGIFITNCQHYAVTAPFRIASHIDFAPLGKNGMNTDGMNSPHPQWETGGENGLYNTPGVLHVDEYGLWPRKAHFILGDYPETWSVQKKIAYRVAGNGKTLAAGQFNAWILGQGKVDVNVAHIKTLTLTTLTGPRGSGFWAKLKTIFWGNPRIITADGKVIYLSALKYQRHNIIPTTAAGTDYAGGPVQIAGNVYQQVLAAEPKNTQNSGVITVNLSGLHAVRFVSVIGGDWPVGNQNQLRKVCAIRTSGRTARFLTLIEPYHQRMVKSAVAHGPDELTVNLAHGIQDVISIHHLAGNGKNMVVSLHEIKGGRIIAKESTAAQ